MLDENLNVADDTTTTYSKENLETLIDRIRKIENNDTTIISLPRLGNSPNAMETEFISQQLDSFLNLNCIDIETATIWEVEEGGTVTIDLRNESEIQTKKSWWKIWK
ncbi:hypothetical protein V9L05_18395 [Bernardetia sp. Wsw4-3y2]|uniref:hypothetical protein n=1 Tax=Bernardetia sp. Wsw4-3y2 TaxID=3127471 RepID=UPI0030CCB98E